MRRWVAHIDIDSFFVSCERVKNPAYAGKPVVKVVQRQHHAGRGYGRFGWNAVRFARSENLRDV